MKIKLLIWDLDDTLWSGTLDEINDVRIIEQRADMIRRLNRHGIVSAICSKNDRVKARAKLEEFGLWDEFVFRRISFSPKGASVSQILDDMHLQSKHTLFIDDNPSNLGEVQHACPGINVVDANSTECDRLLELIIAENQSILKSRVDEYRILDQKITDQAAAGVSREQFLSTCGLRVCLVHRMDNMEFAGRIEELVNRTNQLNFLKSRMEVGSAHTLIADITRTECYSLFAWDNYGYHGLIGFAAVAAKTELRHFAFSCRIMHMGVEPWMLAKLLQLFPKLQIEATGITPGLCDWVGEDDFSISTMRRYIREREAITTNEKTNLRIMANCQSGALAHFSGLGPIAEFDNMPRIFTLDNVLGGYHKTQNFPTYLVYAPFSDYWEAYWPIRTRGEQFVRVFKDCAEEFMSFLATSNHKILFILPPEDASEDKYKDIRYGVPREIIKIFNLTFREIANRLDFASVLEVATIADPSELIDARHFEVSLLRKIASEIRSWYSGYQD